MEPYYVALRLKLKVCGVPLFVHGGNLQRVNKPFENFLNSVLDQKLEELLKLNISKQPTTALAVQHHISLFRHIFSDMKQYDKWEHMRLFYLATFIIMCKHRDRSDTVEGLAQCFYSLTHKSQLWKQL